MKTKEVLKKLGVKHIYDLQYRCADHILEKFYHLPQSYSFITLGSHGVGMHAFLYYLSLCEGIYPLPWSTLCRDKIQFGARGHCITLRFISFYLENKHFFKTHRWGLTFDGAFHSKEWMQKNVTLENIPVFSLVRDPVAITVSAINYALFWQVYYELDKLWIDFIDFENWVLNYIGLYVNLMINFKTNLNKLQEKYCSISYIDTMELVGGKAYATMQKVGKVLNIDVLPREEFGMSINGPFQRCFPQTFNIDGISFRVSPFKDNFSLDVNTLQYCQNYQDKNLNIQTYKSDLFPQHTLYITSQCSEQQRIRAQKALQEKLHDFLAKIKNKIEKYESLKVSGDDVISCLKKSKEYDAIKRKFEYETEDVLKEREDLLKEWKYYRLFLGL